jgi:hypothetical protein
MTIRPVGDKLFDADRWTDRQTDSHDEANSLLFEILRTGLAVGNVMSPWHGATESVVTEDSR